MKCRSCGTEIADNALICYKCGTATAEPRIKPPAKQPRRNWLPWATVLVAGLALAAVIREVACGSLL